jgi:hypothetical protein
MSKAVAVWRWPPIPTRAVIENAQSYNFTCCGVTHLYLLLFFFYYVYFGHNCVMFINIYESDVTVTCTYMGFLYMLCLKQK